MGPEFDLDTKITVPEVRFCCFEISFRICNRCLLLKVLLVGSKKATVVGQPVVPESQVNQSHLLFPCNLLYHV